MTDFIDESGKIWDRANGDTPEPGGIGPAINTSNYKFGGGALYISPASYKVIQTPDHSDFILGASDWTFDFWFRPVVDWLGPVSVVEQYVDNNNFFQIWTTNTDIQCLCKLNSSYVWWFYLDSDCDMSIGQFHHVAVVRNGGTPYIFLDGTSLAVFEDTTISGKTGPDFGAPMRIHLSYWGDFAVQEGDSSPFIDEWRFSSGIARWTADFTPPIAEYSLDANTKSLLHFNPPTAFGGEVIIWS